MHYCKRCITHHTRNQISFADSNVYVTGGDTQRSPCSAASRRSTDGSRCCFEQQEICSGCRHTSQYLFDVHGQGSDKSARPEKKSQLTTECWGNQLDCFLLRLNNRIVEVIKITKVLSAVPPAFLAWDVMPLTGRSLEASMCSILLIEKQEQLVAWMKNGGSRKRCVELVCQTFAYFCFAWS